MTEREKMAQIIAEYLCPQGKAHKRLYGAARRCYSRNNFADCERVSECVDALIEAGYGDVQSLTKGNLVTRCTPYAANFHIRIVKKQREKETGENND